MKRALCWLRRDLRLEDHHALSKALQECDQVYLCFIFDTQLIQKIKDEMDFFEQKYADRRLGFIWQALEEIQEQLTDFGAQLIVRTGDPKKEIPQLCQELKIDKLYFNRDYEPSAKKRDLGVISQLEKNDTEIQHFKDHVIFEHNQVRTLEDKIYKVFTPYKRQWRKVFQQAQTDVLKTMSTKSKNKKLAQYNEEWKPLEHWEKQLGITFSKPPLPGRRDWALNRLEDFKKNQIENYHKGRDFPALECTSQLSASIRHGLVSVRELIKAADSSQQDEGAQTWMDELIWREFYQMILDTHPHVVHSPFKEDYKKIKWRGDKKLWKAWCRGETGYPLIDAAMRGLNQTGMIHNRLRMVVASFLCKTLLVDWQIGERYFALKLLDFDLAANNGGWQWSSSTGCDAQPYFRIFNPYTQSEKFDADGEFIKLYCPELRELGPKSIHCPEREPPLELGQKGVVLGQDYPQAIVDYKQKRQEALEMYSVVKSS